MKLLKVKYTGELTGIPTYKEGKIIALDAWLESQNANASTIHFYSDSINDQPLLERADQAFVVDPDPALAHLAKDRGWPVIQFFRLSESVMKKVGYFTHSDCMSHNMGHMPRKSNAIGGDQCAAHDPRTNA